jgi:hypothetical protein
VSTQVGDLRFLDCHVWRARRVIAAPSYRVLLNVEPRQLVEALLPRATGAETETLPVTRLTTSPQLPA